MSITNPDNAAALAANNPHLFTVAAWTGSNQALAAKNIRAELKRAFPGQKFSVTSDSFSMGDSVDVRWTDGPTTDEINAIIGKYENSTFDGMTDSSSPVHNDWHIFGETKYANSHRDVTPERYIEIAVEMGHPGAKYERGEMVGEGIDYHRSQTIKRATRARSYYAKPGATMKKADVARMVNGTPDTEPAPFVAIPNPSTLTLTPAPADRPVIPHPLGIGTFWCITVVNGHVECFETTPRNLMYQTLGGLKPDDLDSCYLTEKDARTAAAMLTRELAETAVRLAERALADAKARLAEMK